MPRTSPAPEAARASTPGVLFVTSLPGAGAASVASELGHLWGVSALDTDVLVERMLGCSLADAFIDLGEQKVRAAELQAVTSAIAVGGVIAVGSGVIDSGDGRALVSAHRSVFLDVSLRTASARLGLGLGVTALINPRATLMRQADARRPVYRRLAEFCLTTDDLTPREAAEKVAAEVRSPGGDAYNARARA